MMTLQIMMVRQELIPLDIPLEYMVQIGIMALMNNQSMDLNAMAVAIRI